MPAVARIGDPFATGHGCDGSSTIAQGSGNVRANGIPVSRVGDMSAGHTRPVGDACVGHTAPIASGSGTVRVNGIPVARVGDAIDSGAITGGSPTVAVGG